MRLFDDSRGRVVGLAFRPGGGSLAACSRGAKQLSLYDLGAGGFRRWHPKLQCPVTACGYSPDGAWLAVGGESGRAVAHRAAGPDPAPDPAAEARGESCVDAVAIAAGPDGRVRLAVASDQVRVYDLAGKEEWDVELPGRWKFYRSLAFGPGGDVLASCNRARVVTVWDLAGRRLAAHRELSAQPAGVAFSPAGDLLAVAFGKWATLFRAGDLAPVGVVLDHPRPVYGVAYHPTRAAVLTAGGDGTVRLWDPAAGAELRAWDWGIGPVTAVAVAADGLTAAAGGETGQVVVWDLDG